LAGRLDAKRVREIVGRERQYTIRVRGGPDGGQLQYVFALQHRRQTLAEHAFRRRLALQDPRRTPPHGSNGPLTEIFNLEHEETVCTQKRISVWSCFLQRGWPLLARIVRTYKRGSLLRCALSDAPRISAKLVLGRTCLFEIGNCIFEHLPYGRAGSSKHVCNHFLQHRILTDAQRRFATRAGQAQTAIV